MTNIWKPVLFYTIDSEYGIMKLKFLNKNMEEGLRGTRLTLEVLGSRVFGFRGSRSAAC